MNLTRSLKGAALGAVVLAGLTAVPASSHASTFTVTSGDDLYAVAKRNGIPLWVLETSNPQLDGALLPGDRVVIPKQLLALLIAAVNTQNQVASPNAYPYAPEPTASQQPAQAQPASPSGGQQSSPLGDLAKLFTGQGGQGGTPALGSSPAGSSPSGFTSSPGSSVGSPAASAPSSSAGDLGTGASSDPGSDAGSRAIDAIKSGQLVNPNTGTKDWSKWCLALVATAFKKATGRDIPELAKSGAWDAYLAFQKEGLVKQGNPPKGAIVFWSPQERARMQPGSKGAIYGHIALSNGDGTVVSNVKGGIGTVPIATFGSPAGYVVIK